MENNSGISIGGNFTGGNATTGDHSPITNTVTQGPGVDALKSAIDQLLAAMQSTKEPISDKEDVVGTVNALKEEVQKEKPNKHILEHLGKAVKEGLSYVKDLAPIAASILTQISAMTH